MSEKLLASGWEQLAMNLLSIRRSRSWMQHAASWEVYCRNRWSLTKSRAKLLCNFGKLCMMVRELYLPVPESPENVAPILSLTHKRWIAAYQVCLDYSEGKPINAQHCEATLAQFGMAARKRLPLHVLNARKFQKATKDIASFEDGEKLADQLGTNGVGKYHDDAVRVLIDVDQSVRDLRSGR